jgi:hypothetical protein
MRQQLSDFLKQPFFFCAALVFSVLPLSAADVFGLALQVEGEVFVTRGILEFEAAVEEVLMWDDEIETGEDGTIQLTFDSSFLSIGPNTLVSFEKELNDEGEELFIMTLEQGSFRSKILNMGSRQFFEVHTDGGKLRVHGTDFVTSFDGESDAGFNVAVLQGRVALSAPEEDSGSDDGALSESGDSDSNGSADAPAPVMLTQNQSGGVDAGGDSAEVNEMSFSDADSIRGKLPIPGDGDAGLVIADLGIENIEVESFVEEIKEVQNDGGGAPLTPSTITSDDIISEAIQTIELSIQGGIDSGS